MSRPSVHTELRKLFFLFSIYDEYSCFKVWLLP